MGLGYIGLTLANEFLQAGFKVHGFDTSEEKINALVTGKNSFYDVSPDKIINALATGHFAISTDKSILADMDAVAICVQTPLRKTKDPDISFIVQAVDILKPYLHEQMLVVLESTTYPGMTDEVIKPAFEAQGFAVGKDLFLAYSPERVDPGNTKWGIRNTPRVIGGITKVCLDVACLLYSKVCDHLVPVSSTRAAELCKLYENLFRTVNIALANEVAIMSEHLGVDVWEVIEAAATKPFGFIPFYPGPGIGGHCLPIDPHYLSWKLRKLNYDAKFVALASDINSSMPGYVARRIMSLLEEHGKKIDQSRIFILGVTYKANVADIRESPALDLIVRLKAYGADVIFFDPYVDELEYAGIHIPKVNPTDEELSKSDCTVLITDHSSFDLARMISASKLFFDSRNAAKDFHDGKIHKL